MYSQVWIDWDGFTPPNVIDINRQGNYVVSWFYDTDHSQSPVTIGPAIYDANMHPYYEIPF